MRTPLLAATALAFAAAVLATPLASAELLVDGGRDATIDVGRLVDGFSGAARFPFQAPGDGQVYAKLLPLPGNAVNDGTAANGTVSPAGDGVSGWWVTMSFWNGGAPVAGSRAVARVDGTPTDAVRVASGAALTLQVAVHAPSDAFLDAATHRVHVVLAYRPAQDASEGSGGVMDDAVSLTMTVRQALGSTGTGPNTQPQSDAAQDAPVVSDGGNDGGRSGILSPLIVGASLGAVVILGGAVVLSAFRSRRRGRPAYVR